MQDKKFYLTKEGLDRIKKDYASLRELKFAKVKGETFSALSSEDLNPEYLAFQEDMIFLESKLVNLENIIKNAELIKIPQGAGQKTIGLGATVLVEVDGEVDEFTLVGSLEANPTSGKISNESPVGQRLLGRKVGDEILVSSPVETVYKIKKIKYHSA